MVHQYGPHIFNTNHEDVWSYVNRFGTIRPFVNRVKAVTERGVYGLPINLLTINQFFGKTFDPKQAEAFCGNWVIPPSQIRRVLKSRHCGSSEGPL